MRESIEYISQLVGKATQRKVSEKFLMTKTFQLLNFCSNLPQSCLKDFLKMEREFRQIFQKELKLGLFISEDHWLAQESIGPIFFLGKFLIKNYANGKEYSKESLIEMIARCLELFVYDQTFSGKIKRRRMELERKIVQLKKKIRKMRMMK